MPNRLVIYAHYDQLGIIHKHVEFTLKSLRSIAARIVFVTTSKLQTAEYDKLKDLADDLLEVENIGYDFYSWKSGILSIENQLKDLDELVLINSSVIGPVFPLIDVFNKMQKSRADFWGMTESYETNYHLQSYFLVFNNKIITSTAFIEYWKNLEPISERQEVINTYELKLTGYFIDKGFKADSYIKISDIKKSKIKYWFFKFRPKRNPTLFYPFELLKLKMPFVKIQLLRDNPYDINISKIIEKCHTCLKPDYRFN